MSPRARRVDEARHAGLEYVDPVEERHALKRLAWEHGGELSDSVERNGTLYLWQPVFFGGFWRSLETFSNAELRGRIPAAVLEAEGL